MPALLSEDASDKSTACDDAALAIGVPAPDHAGHLLDMTRALVARRRPAGARALKAQGIAGTVIIKSLISTTGEPLNPQVVDTAVNFGLAQAALDVVRQCRYQPTLLNGQPGEIQTTIQVAFGLDP